MSYKKSFWNNNNVNKMYELENAEEEILQPFIAEIIHSIKPKNMLDFGCGYGYLSTLLNENINIHLFDKNKINSKSLKTNRTKKNTKVLENINEIKDLYYDCIVLSSVLMCIETKEEIKEILLLLQKAKSKKGSLIINITHPCFLQYKYGHYWTSFTENDFDYFNEGKSYQVYMKNDNKKPVSFDDYQWTLSTLMNLPLELGYELVSIIEHPDMPYKTNEYNNKVCPWMFMIFK